MDRKTFFKYLGLGTGAALTAGSMPLQAHTEELNKEHLTFLKEYAQWLKEFNRFILSRTENPDNYKNNQRLMALSKEAEKRKPKLEQLMKDPVFKQHFDFITEEVTNGITV